MYSNSAPFVKITKNKEDVAATEEWTQMGCSEVELSEGGERNVIVANVYEAMNLQTVYFEGTMFFTITDESGSPLFSFGESSYIPELAYMDCLYTPVKITESMDKEIPDGQYRLYISARKTNQQTSSFVVQSNAEIPEAPTKELYYRVIVKKGVAYIDNKEYEITPTGIGSVLLSPNDEPTYYTLDGRMVYELNSSHKGIYIMLLNGKKRKICH